MKLNRRLAAVFRPIGARRLRPGENGAGTGAVRSLFPIRVIAAPICATAVTAAGVVEAAVACSGQRQSDLACPLHRGRERNRPDRRQALRCSRPRQPFFWLPRRA
jgi:hypothetical protein